MARILYLHGVSGGGHKAQILRGFLPGHEVIAPTLPFAGNQGFPAGNFGQWVDIARDHLRAMGGCDLVVGSSMGGAIGLALAGQHPGTFPLLLLAPVWNTKIKKDGVVGSLAGMGGHPAAKILAKVPGIATLAGAGLAGLLFGFSPPGSAPPRTVVLHSANDELFDIGESRSLLAASPATGPDLEWADRISARMAAAGFPHDGADKRLYPVGDGHRMDDGRATSAMGNACLAILS
jgi:pimeloyl-ACP methyl ester carboxylesterase